MRVYLNKYLENDLKSFSSFISIESEVEQWEMLYKHRKRFYQTFQFCHFLRDINLSFDQKSFDEDSQSMQIIWLHTQQISYLQAFVWLRHTIWNKLQHTTNLAWNRVQTSNDVETNCWIHRSVLVSLIRLQE